MGGVVPRTSEFRHSEILDTLSMVVCFGTNDKRFLDVVKVTGHHRGPEWAAVGLRVGRPHWVSTTAFLMNKVRHTRIACMCARV